MSSNQPSQTQNGGGPSSKSQMPPGMVMGPDGKPCKVCTAFRNWHPRSTTNAKAGAGSTAAAMAAFASTTMPSATALTPSLFPPPASPPPDCPADVETLGRATWTFLHTTAAYYPEKPTPTQRANMLMLLRSLPVLYACSTCAADFGQEMAQSPPDVSGRAGLSKWLCERHNEVNVKLGKEKFECNDQALGERWRDGPADGRCG